MSNVLPKFQQYCQTYDKATPIQSDVALFLAKKILNIPYDFHHQIWVDVGCGTGKLSHAILQQLSQHNLILEQLIGIDNSPAMLEHWQFTCSNIANDILLSPVLADMTALPFANHSIDAVISSFALHWTTPKVIVELGRVVKSGGYLFLAIPVKGSFSQVSERFAELPIYPFLPSDDWKTAIFQLIAKRQGELLFLEERSFHHTYSNLKNLLNQLKQMGGAVSGQSPINPTLLRQYLKDISPITLNYRMLIVGIKIN